MGVLTGASILATIFTFGATSGAVAATATSFGAELTAGTVTTVANTINTVSSIASSGINVAVNKQKHSKFGETTATLGLIASAIPGISLVSKGATYASDTYKITSQSMKYATSTLKVISKSKTLLGIQTVLGLGMGGTTMYSGVKQLESGNMEGVVNIMYAVVGIGYAGLGATKLMDTPTATTDQLTTTDQPTTTTDQPTIQQKTTTVKNYVKVVKTGIKLTKLIINYLPVLDFTIHDKDKHDNNSSSNYVF
jgi:hypothetical protein